MPSETTEFKKKRKKSGGRVAGTPNRITTVVKQSILEAFDELGGVNYLVEVGKTEPKSFLVLLAKIVPAELKAEVRTQPDKSLVEYMEAATKRVKARERLDANGEVVE